MKPLVLLDFDGVLFNSAYEAYQVCETLAQNDDLYRRAVSFDEFMLFRAQLTDAWQFCRLYQKNRVLQNITKLHEIKADDQDWKFAEKFFATRAEMIQNPDWAKLMSPYPFFYQLSNLLIEHNNQFKILSTRNQQSILRTLEYFGINNIDIFGQESIRKFGSKLLVAKSQPWFNNENYVIYIDDMSSHLEPFESEVDLCIHASWGYGEQQDNSLTQSYAFKLISGFLKLT